MESKDFDRFSRAFQDLFLAFERKKQSELVSLYFKHLSHYELHDVLQAIDVAVERCNQFPKVAELIRFIDGDGEQQALTAFETLKTALGYGKTATMIIEDPVMGHALEDMWQTWPNTCHKFLSVNTEVEASELKRLFIKSFLHHWPWRWKLEPVPMCFYGEPIKEPVYNPTPKDTYVIDKSYKIMRIDREMIHPPEIPERSPEQQQRIDDFIKGMMQRATPSYLAKGQPSQTICPN
jgi:hypothetical protein